MQRDDTEDDPHVPFHLSDGGRQEEPPRGLMEEDSPFVPKGSANGGMPRRYVDVIVGGQAGSEGKGAIAEHLVRTEDYGAMVRPGSSNAGHTVYAADGAGWDEYIHQVIPSAATVDPAMDIYMAPESSFGLDEFFEEYQDMIDRWGEKAAGRLTVDPKAAVITGEHRHEEAERKLGDDIGSTVHGCGAVRVEKIWRSAGNVRLAGQYAALDGFMPEGGRRVPDLITEHGQDGESVLIEGTQGTLLSMNQSPHWPYSTSRDCTAPAFLSSAGVPPTATRHTWAVFRTYPIRVGGHSGPMDGEEIDFETISERAGHTEPPVEFTSVTKKKRRIFEWSWDQFEFALRLNDPDLIAVTFLDYLDADNYGEWTWWDLTRETREWVAELNNRAREYNGSRVAFLKTGPKPEHAIDLRHKAPATSSERWKAGVLPPADPEELDGAARDAGAGPDGNWFDLHPTPGANYARGDGDEVDTMELAREEINDMIEDPGDD
jgi:adenylosuccinate synthase